MPTSPRPSSWSRFLKRHAGRGLSMAEMSRMYRRAQRTAKVAAKKVAASNPDWILVAAEYPYRPSKDVHQHRIVEIEEAATGVRLWFDRVRTVKGKRKIVVVFKAGSMAVAKKAAANIRRLPIRGLQVKIETR